MSNISAPKPNDILCGRGNRTNVHKGNKFFRILVKNFKLDYVISKHDEKKVITNVILTTIRNLNPPGRFLKHDPKTNLWHDIGEKNAYLKISQALREGAPEILKGITPNAISVPSKSLSSSKAPEVNGVNEDDGEESKHLGVERALKTEPKLENKDTPRQDTGSVHHCHDTSVLMMNGNMSSIGSGENTQMELFSFQVENFQECSVEIDKHDFFQIFGKERSPNSHHGSCSSISELFSLSDNSMSDLSFSFPSSLNTSDLSAILQLAL